MTRLILLLALVLVLWFLVESRLRRLRRRFEAAHQARSAAAARQPTGTTAPTELLVRCDRCGSYIPQSRARLESGGAFCHPSCPGAAATPA